MSIRGRNGSRSARPGLLGGSRRGRRRARGRGARSRPRSHHASRDRGGDRGPPDNAAAAVFGGFTMVVDERVVARFDLDPELRPALFVPADITISTEDARRALPQTIPREDAVANAGHAALTAVALLHEPGLLPVAMRDRLHEDVRLGLVPGCARSTTASVGRGSPCASRVRGRRCWRSSGTTPSRPKSGTGGGSCVSRWGLRRRSAKAEGAYHLRRWWKDDRARPQARARADGEPVPQRRRTLPAGGPVRGGHRPGPGHRSREQDAGREGRGDLPYPISRATSTTAATSGSASTPTTRGT